MREFSRVNRYPKSKQDRSTRTNYASMNGRWSVAELLEVIANKMPSIPLDHIRINYGTLVWTDDATPEEIARDEEFQSRNRERHTAWRQRTYKELKKEFGWRRFFR